MPQLGETRTSSKTGRTARWDGKGWLIISNGPEEASSPPQGGAGGASGYKLRPGEYHGPDGAVWAMGPRGGRVRIAKAPSSGADDLTGSGTGQMKMRLGLGLGPSVLAQDTMDKYDQSAAVSAGYGKPGMFRTGKFLGLPILTGQTTATPLQNDWLASSMDSLAAGWNAKGDKKPTGPAHLLANGIGGDDYRNYNQASDTYVQSLLPVFSGATVTDSEAMRFARANVPQFSDGPEQLQAKSRNRKLLLNYAAQVTGQPMPYPDLPSWESARGGQMQPASPPMKAQGGRSAAPKKAIQVKTVDDYNKVPSGAVYLTPDGRQKVKR